MEIKKLVNKLLRISNDITSIEKAMIYFFVDNKNVSINKSQWLNEYLSEIDMNIYSNVKKHISNEISLDDLITLFEVLTPQKEKKEKGVVYTPDLIKKFIVKNTIDSIFVPIILDPACGCGSFLITAAKYIHDKYSIPFSEIVSKYLYGVDIDENSIIRAKTLLSLLIVINNEEENDSFNLLCANSLDNKTISKLQWLCKKGFDCIVGNPPYVRNKNMNDVTKRLLPNWKSASIGNVDLYMPFFEIGLKLLSPTGKLGYISPNSYLQSANGKSLRSFFSSQKYKIQIIDFRDNQIFDGVTSYTCITLIDKSKSSEIIDYLRLNEKNTLEKHTFSQYNINEFTNGSPWRMRETHIDCIIKKLESTGTPLSNWTIRNGLATLKNDIFFFTPCKEDKTYYYREYEGKQYKIEKGICTPVAKPNIIKNEADLKSKLEIAIFPYIKKEKNFEIINEETFKAIYPETYNFLKKYKNVLQKRDKGHGNYPAWYAYGRTQGMNNFGKKLLIPYICDKPIAVLSLNPNVLFYCGYALISNDTEELKILKVFLESEAFWYYIYHTSKPYSKGYMAFAKNYIINFSIPKLNNKEKNFLLSNKASKEKNYFIWQKYAVNFNDTVNKR